ncbi:electron transfer flavoprotein subunit alpha/FixB family protein [Propionispira raffinosivorans]|uniref:electron transfer flavoprotein subunit alpha/FixB family protein n=1 Tax=Propionispira raffinosivorans TaxID=86959 RepID=UPI000375D9BB|nr:electron transfer flavoprotein subunit alpha/FixB family protein [Propionispira raffinosivorans]
MAKLIVHQEKIDNIKELLGLCPFGALEEQNGQVNINAACKMCQICVKKGPLGAIEYAADAVKGIDKTQWQGVAVYVDHVDGVIHPVTYELLGKARELADKINQPVYALFIGSNITTKSHELLHYGVDKAYIYDTPSLEHFKIEPYAAAFEDFIQHIKPAAILVGATTIGRQLAPRIAARFGTGLTADCTVLEMSENTDLVQIRPAFGGNIMAQILTPNHRPQIATVRYKVMNIPKREPIETGEIIACHINEAKLRCNVQVLNVVPKEKEKFIDSAEVLIVAGRGVKKQADLEMLQELADLLGGQVASTRPITEAGWLDAKHQVGLSGRTVRPKLIITCGVSGSVQFVAGMNHSDVIMSINKDPKANIFHVANYGLVGDIYDIIPKLIEKIKIAKGVSA